MVLVSIHPFALRKVFLVIVAFLCFSALCFADPVLMVHRYAPPSRLKSPPTAPQSLEVRPEFDPLGMIDSPVNQAELQLAERNRLLLPSSLVRTTRCELRPTDLTAFVAARPSLLLPSDD